MFWRGFFQKSERKIMNHHHHHFGNDNEKKAPLLEARRTICSKANWQFSSTPLLIGLWSVVEKGRSLNAFILWIVSEAFDTLSISLFRETGPPVRIKWPLFLLRVKQICRECWLVWEEVTRAESSLLSRCEHGFFAYYGIRFGVSG